MCKKYAYRIYFYMPWDEDLKAQRVFGCYANTEDEAVERLKTEWPEAIIETIINAGERTFI